MNSVKDYLFREIIVKGDFVESKTNTQDSVAVRSGIGKEWNVKDYLPLKPIKNKKKPKVLNKDLLLWLIMQLDNEGVLKIHRKETNYANCSEGGRTWMESQANTHGINGLE